jgi:lysophospholipase L1-like esterase
VSVETYLAPLIGKTIVNLGIGGELSSQIRDRVLADQSHRADVIYLWAVANDVNKADTSPEKAKYNVRRILEHLTPTRRKVLLLQEPYSSNEPLGSALRTGANGREAYNAMLAKNFPEYYVPIADWLLTPAAAAAVNYTFTTADLADIANGVTPVGFRSDQGHLNSLGNQAAAFYIHSEEVARGWI